MPPRSTKLQQQAEDRRKKDLAAAHEKGRTRGIGDALLLLGLGIGLGVATALEPRRCPSCLQAAHEGECPTKKRTET